MVDHARLASDGWVSIDNAPTQKDFLEIARSLGRPVPSPTGELIKRIRVREGSSGRQGTLSTTYGTAEFPLHTDTAFWPTPARYLVIRATGDIRRETRVKSFARLFEEAGDTALMLADKSIWRLRTPTEGFYCSMRFVSDKLRGWRFDRQCMSPANEAAAALIEAIEKSGISYPSEHIVWARGEVLVLSNWDVLHGRGPAPADEGERILERIYVR
jgi:alpha-ketoglutarate-dependent taurine dioxygenase